jgi:hypothetical protein
MDEVATQHTQLADYGLRNAVLSPMETLAQSVSTMAPTTPPLATLPLVCASRETVRGLPTCSPPQPRSGRVCVALCTLFGLDPSTLTYR